EGVPKTVDPAAVVSVKDYKLASKFMGRLMPYRVILPVGYSRTAPGYPVIYLLHGLTGNYKDWTDRTELVKLSEKYQFIIVTVEGENGWYTDSAIKAADKFESHLDEIVLETDKQFNTNRSYRVIAGLSMGGYGAIKFAIRRPDKFSLIGSFSGAFGIPQWSENAPGSKLIGRSIDAVFGPIGSQAREQNNITKIVGDMTPPQVQALPYIYISCGTEDAAMIKLNRDFVAILEKKGLRPQTNFQAAFRKGIHDWAFWGSELATFLELANTRLTSKGIDTTKATQHSP
ncbi:MAG: alpha/beta hydrolase-fold protein, partial [Pyrinomonadaceae bacterium]